MMDDLLARVEGLTARGLADAVSRGVRDGVFPAGETLPPIRAVAAALQVSPATVHAAWALLARESSEQRADVAPSSPIRPSPGRHAPAACLSTPSGSSSTFLSA